MNEMKFKDFIKLNRGFDLPNDKMIDGNYPVVASTDIKFITMPLKSIHQLLLQGVLEVSVLSNMSMLSVRL